MRKGGGAELEQHQPRNAELPKEKPQEGRTLSKKIKVNSRHELSKWKGDFPAPSAPRCSARAAHPRRPARGAAL